MAKVDRLGWAAGIYFVNHGSRIGVRVTDRHILSPIRRRLPPGWRPTRSSVVDCLYSLVAGEEGARSRVRRHNLLYVGSSLLARAVDLDEVLEVLESDLHFRVALLARRRVFVHAGAVGWQGRAIVVPGASGSGKSSLVAALVRAGATYYSDEFAVFDTRGRVLPYSKPLYLRQTDGERRRKISAETLGGRAGSKPLPLGLVAVTEYRSGARWRPRRMSPAESMLQLLANTVVARIRPELALNVLHRAVPGAMALKGKRGEAEDVVGPLLRHMAAGAFSDRSR